MNQEFIFLIRTFLYRFGIQNVAGHVYLPGDLSSISGDAFEGSNPLQEKGYPTVRPGDQGDAVLEIQNILVQKGYLGSKYVTGEYDVRTENAVKDFQADHGIEITGICKSDTMKALHN